MILADSNVNIPLIVALSILGVLVVIAGLVLLYIFVIYRMRCKSQIKDLAKKFSYLDALLIGQDSQYIHRIEIISRSNLLYVEKHEQFSKRFKQIYENDDKFAEQIIKQLKALVDNKQFKALKKHINDGKRAVLAFEEKVNALDNDLFALIKPEEDSRQAILKLKDDYRRLKQIFYSNSSDLDLVSGSFIKVFDKLDAKFVEFENLIECADYDSANNMVPEVEKVITALENALVELPNLCILTISVVPQKIEELKTKFDEVEKEGLPLYNLSFITKYDEWIKSLEVVKNRLINLQISTTSATLNRILDEVSDVQNKLDDEISAKEFFVSNIDRIYGAAIDLEKKFLKICSILPTLQSVYKVEDHQEEDISELKVMMEHLGSAKRALDNYVHSNQKQPFSTLKGKLDELSETYDKAFKGVSDFKAYVDSIKTSSEEAYSLVFVYFYRLKQIEAMLREMNIDNLTGAYHDKIEYCYELVNTIDKLIKTKPIDVKTVNENVEELKLHANNLFDDTEETYRQMQLAENAIVYANRDRNRQSDVDIQLTALEEKFFVPEFDKVYRDANMIYHKNHVEDNAHAR